MCVCQCSVWKSNVLTCSDSKSRFSLERQAVPATRFCSESWAHPTPSLRMARHPRYQELGDHPQTSPTACFAEAVSPRECRKWTRSEVTKKRNIKKCPSISGENWDDSWGCYVWSPNPPVHLAGWPHIGSDRAMCPMCHGAQVSALETCLWCFHNPQKRREMHRNM